MFLQCPPPTTFKDGFNLYEYRCQIPYSVADALDALRTENLDKVGDALSLYPFQSLQVRAGFAHSNLVLLTGNTPPRLGDRLSKVISSLSPSARRAIIAKCLLIS